MSDWQPDIVLTDALVRSILVTQCPALSVESVFKFGTGWDNVVYSVNREYIFRFPTRHISASLVERELQLLPTLSQCLPLEIPNPVYQCAPSDIFPYYSYGYRYLPGSTGCQFDFTFSEYRACAKTLAHFLSVLHGIDLSVFSHVQEIDKVVFDRCDKDQMLKKFHKRLKQVRAVFMLDDYQKCIKKICEKAYAVKLKEYTPALVHGDLYHRHLLFSKQKVLQGVIDWGDVGVSNPVVDLAVLYQFFPRAVHHDFYAVYGDVSDAQRDYAEFLGLYYAISLLWYGHAMEDRHLVRTSMQTLDYLLVPAHEREPA